jgi:hypothetical protein
VGRACAQVWRPGLIWLDSFLPAWTTFIAHSIDVPQLCRVQVTQHELCLASRARRVYANAHTYHVNSISVNSDQATFLSADDLRINLWSLEVTNTSFNIVDIKPPNMEDLTEVRHYSCTHHYSSTNSRSTPILSIFPFLLSLSLALSHTSLSIINI